MCLRAEEGERIADKTVLKMMGEMGLRCGIRRETKYHRYNSYKGDVGQSFDNIIGRDFKADGPWQGRPPRGDRTLHVRALKAQRPLGLCPGLGAPLRLQGNRFF